MRALFLLLGAMCLFTANLSAQGNLNPPAAPAPTMKTLQEIWDKIGTLQNTVDAQQQQLTVLEQQNNLLIESTGVPLAWVVTTVDSIGTVGSFSSLAFQPNGHPAISYYDASNADLKYAAYNGTAWITNTIDSAGGVGQYTSLAFAPSGQPTISYYDATNQSLKFAFSDGTNWQITAIDSGNVGQYTSLAFSPSGQPAISYYDLGRTDLKFAQFDGTNWLVTFVDTNGIAGLHSSLAFSPAGQPAISYTGGGDLKYASFNGTNWTVATVDIKGGLYTSLAFGPDGRPAISYLVQNVLNFATHVSGATWTNAILDMGDGNPPSAAGEYCSLAFGADGQPAISYRYITANMNPAGGSLKYARFNGTAWSLSTVTEDDAEYTSLAFGPNLQPSISYYDRTAATRDLKIARRAIFSPAP